MIKTWEATISFIANSLLTVKEFDTENIELYIYEIYDAIKNEITFKYRSLTFQEEDNILFLTYRNKLIFELGVVDIENGSFVYSNNKLNGQEVTISSINVRSLQQTCNDFRSFVNYTVYEASLLINAKTTPVGSYPLDNSSVNRYITSFINSINNGNVKEANNSSQYLFDYAVSVIRNANYYLVESYPDVGIWKNGSSEIALYRYLPFTPFTGVALGLIITSPNDYTGMVGLYNPENNSESITLFIDTLKSYLPVSSYNQIRNISLSLPEQFHNMSNDQILDLLHIVVNTAYFIDNI